MCCAFAEFARTMFSMNIKDLTEGHTPSPVALPTDVPRPTVDLPTIALAMLLALVWCVNVAVFMANPEILGAGIHALISTVIVYLSFTVVHECSHRNTARGYPALNDAIGYLFGFLFQGSYRQFVPIHLAHHAHTNMEHRDPDHFVRGGLNPWNFFRWTAALYFYFDNFLKFRMSGRKVPWFGILLPYAFLVTVYAAAYFQGWLRELLMIYTIPSFIGTIVTLFLFDYLPHAPHVDRGRYTNSHSYVGSALNAFFMMQNVHIVHHLWPNVSWWRTAQIYRRLRPQLREAGHIERIK